MMRLDILIVTGIALAASAAKLPKELNLEICRWNDPEIQKCMRRAVEIALPKFKNGAPSVGIPKLEPLEITEITLDFGDRGPINMKTKVKNLQIFGLTTTKVPELTFEKDKGTISAKLLAEKIELKGNFEAEGSIIGVPMKNKGLFQSTLKNILTQVTMNFEEVDRKGVKHWNLKNLDTSVIGLDDVKFKFDGLIKGNSALDESLNQLINENWRELDAQTRPIVVEASRQQYMVIAQRFLRKVPLSELFPDKK